jgi:hypothetical protein
MIEAFRRNYVVEEGSQLPADGKRPVFYYPGAQREGGRNGTIITVKPTEGPSWTGCFASGYRSGLALSETCSCADPNEVCVVSCGAAYVVRVDNPQKWQELPCFPVTQLVPVPDSGLLIFCDFTKLLALGIDGIKWVTSSLATDGLRIVSVKNSMLRVSGWKGGYNAEIETCVELLTGQETR